MSAEISPAMPGQLQCVVVTPEQTVYAAEASFVTVTLFDGELGIAHMHAPLIGRLGFGELRVTRADDPRQVDRYYVEGGFVEVAQDVVTILTGYAVKRADLKADEAQGKIDAALSSSGDSSANTASSKAARDLALRQGNARLRLAQRH